MEDGWKGRLSRRETRRWGRAEEGSGVKGGNGGEGEREGWSAKRYRGRLKLI